MKRMAKSFKNIFKKILIIYLIFFISISEISSSSISFADQEFNDSARSGIAANAKAFAEKWKGKAYYSRESEVRITGDSKIETCCTSGLYYFYKEYLGVNLNQLGWGACTTIMELPQKKPDYFKQISFSEIKPGDFVVNSGHIEMAINDGGTERLDTGSESPNAITITDGNPATKFTMAIRFIGKVTPTGATGSETTGKSEDKFYYQGLPTGSYAGSKTTNPLQWLINLISQIAEFLAGILIYIIKMVIIGWVNIVVVVITQAINALTGDVEDTSAENETSNSTAGGTENTSGNTAGAGTTTGTATASASGAASPMDNNAQYTPSGSELQPSGGEEITVEKIIFNKVPLLDANVFKMNEAGGVKLKEDSSLAVIRRNIAQWYYVIRTASIILMLLILIYIGIKMAISTIASEQAMYKEMLKNWLVGFIIIFFIQFFLIAVMQINEVLLGWISNARTTLLQGLKGSNLSNNDVIDETSIYETIRTKAYDFKISSGLVGTCLYIALVIMMIKFLYIYIKRVFAISILIIMAPFMGAAYAYSKTKTGKAESFGKWMKDYTMLVFMQPIHALVYVTFVTLALQISDLNFGAMLFVIVVMNFMAQAGDIFTKIFNLGGGSFDNVMKSDIITSITGANIVMSGFGIARNAVHKIGAVGSGIYNFGKDIISAPGGFLGLGGKAKMYRIAEKNGLSFMDLSNFQLTKTKNLTKEDRQGKLFFGQDGKYALKYVGTNQGRTLLSDRLGVLRRGSVNQRRWDALNAERKVRLGALKGTYTAQKEKVWNVIRLSTAIPLVMTGNTTTAVAMGTKALNSLQANHQRRKTIRGYMKENPTYQARKMTGKKGTAARKLADAVTFGLASDIRGERTNFAHAMKDYEWDSKRLAKPVAGKDVRTKYERLNDAETKERNVLTKYHAQKQAFIEAHGGDPKAGATFDHKLSKEIDGLYKTSKAVDKYLKDNNLGPNMDTDAMTGALESMEGMMRKNLRNNLKEEFHGEALEAEVEKRMDGIWKSVNDKWDIEEASGAATVNKERFKNFVDDAMSENGAQAKVTEGMEEVHEAMKDLLHEDRDYHAEYGEKYIYNKEGNGNASNLKNMFKSLTFDSVGKEDLEGKTGKEKGGPKPEPPKPIGPNGGGGTGNGNDPKDKPSNPFVPVPGEDQDKNKQKDSPNSPTPKDEPPKGTPNDKWDPDKLKTKMDQLGLCVGNTPFNREVRDAVMDKIRNGAIDMSQTTIAGFTSFVNKVSEEIKSKKSKE